MKLQLKLLPLLATIMLYASSCSTPELQESYDCKCDEIARKFSHYQYDDFVAKWGAPNDKFYDAENPYYVNVQWDNSSLFSDGSPIMMEFAICDGDKPCQEPKKFHCQGEPYIGGDGQTHRISYEVK